MGSFNRGKGLFNGFGRCIFGNRKEFFMVINGEHLQQVANIGTWFTEFVLTNSELYCLLSDEDILQLMKSGINNFDSAKKIISDSVVMDKVGEQGIFYILRGVRVNKCDTKLYNEYIEYIFKYLENPLIIEIARERS